MEKLYVDTSKNMIDMASLVLAAKVLTALADNQDDITFSGDEHGHFFEVPADLMEKFRAAVGDGSTPKKKGGRPRKPAVPEEAAEAVEALSVIDEEIPVEEAEPELEE